MAVTYTESDSYCAHEDVEAICQLGEFDANSRPTLQEVLNFQGQRAGQIYSVLAGTLGSDAPGPAGFSVTIDNTTDTGQALEYVCIRLNAIGAAVDALRAAGAGDNPRDSNRIEELIADYNAGLADGGELETVAKSVLSSSTEAQTHISRGEITKPSVVSRTGQGLPITDATEF